MSLMALRMALYVFTAGRLFDFFDGRLDGSLVGIGKPCRRSPLAVFPFASHLIGLVAGIDEVAFPLSSSAWGFRLLPHVFHLGVAEAAGAFDADLLFLSGPQVLGGDVQNAVGIETKVTSIWGMPRGAGGISSRLNWPSKRLLALSAIGLSP